MKDKDKVQQKSLVSLPEQEVVSSGYHGFELPMIKDFHFDECASALQKSCRRSLEFEAVYWAGVFYRGGYSKYLAKRLKVIMEEDIGLGNVQCLLLANQLYLQTQEKSYKAETSNDGFLKYVNLIILACRSKKTRVADELGNIVLDLIDKLDISLTIDSDYKDSHTRQGKLQWGRWDDNEHEGKALERLNNWFCNWSYLDNEDINYNQYRKINEQIWKLHFLTNEEKEELLRTVTDTIESKRKQIHEKIQTNSKA